MQAVTEAADPSCRRRSSLPPAHRRQLTLGSNLPSAGTVYFPLAFVKHNVGSLSHLVVQKWRKRLQQEPRRILLAELGKKVLHELPVNDLVERLHTDRLPARDAAHDGDRDHSRARTPGTSRRSRVRSCLTIEIAGALRQDAHGLE